MSEYDGSSPLPDPMREAFAQELVAGEPLYAAYQAAGYKCPRGNAQRMLREAEVARRVEWLGNKIAALDETLLAYRKLEHRRALEHIATADRLALWEEKTRYVKTPQGRRRRVRSLELKPLDKLTPDERALIDGFEISDKGAVRIVMPKRLDARAMLAKLDGFEKPTKTALTDPSGQQSVRFIVEGITATET